MSRNTETPTLNKSQIISHVPLEQRLEDDPEPSLITKLYAQIKNKSNFAFEHSDRQVHDFQKEHNVVKHNMYKKLDPKK